MKKRVSFLGLSIDNLSMAETIAEVGRIISERRVSQHVVVNAEKTVDAYFNPELRDIINRCELVNADGQGIIWAARLLGIPLKERVAGIDLMDRLVAEAAEKNWRVFCLGATEAVNDGLLSHYRQRYTGLQISGYHGYFFDGGEAEVVDMIRASRSDILFLGISSPKKEMFISTYLHELNVPFCMGVGGSFDVFAGKTRRAPLWMQRAGLEWLYRVYQEPARIGMRKAKRNPVFVALVLWELLRNAAGLNQKVVSKSSA